MKSKVEILLDENSTQEDKIKSVKNIIDTCELPLSSYNILRTFAIARHQIKTSYLNTYPQVLFLFVTLLNENINMFIAIVKLCTLNYYSCAFSYVISFKYFVNNNINDCDNFNIGYQLNIRDSVIINMYKNLLDLFDFNIDNLVLPEKSFVEIQKYRNDRYGCIQTKPARKI